MDELTRNSGEILRHPTRDRLLHWCIVLCFVFTAASGLALFHPALFFLSNLTGGGPWSAILHPFLGLSMAALFLVFALPLWRENRISQADRQWLRQMPDVLAKREDLLPDVGKYNAGQKLLYFTMIACMLVLIATGFPVWRRYFSGYFHVDVVRIALLAHAVAAFGLVALVLLHVSAAAWVKGSVGAMIEGKVTLGWAYRHHRAWFREVIRHAAGR